MIITIKEHIKGGDFPSPQTMYEDPKNILLMGVAKTILENDFRRKHLSFLFENDESDLKITEFLWNLSHLLTTQAPNKELFQYSLTFNKKGNMPIASDEPFINEDPLFLGDPFIIKKEDKQFTLKMPYIITGLKTSKSHKSKAFMTPA